MQSVIPEKKKCMSSVSIPLYVRMKKEKKRKTFKKQYPRFHLLARDIEKFTAAL